MELNKRLLALGFSVVLITACNNNTADDNRNMGTRDVGFTSDQSSSYMNGGGRDFSATRNHQYGNATNDTSAGSRLNSTYNNNYKGERRSGTASTNRNTDNQNQDSSMNRTGQPTAEIQQTGRGIITIDPNAYSTATPSNKYPHSQYIRGQWKVVRVQPGTAGQPAQQAPKQTAPQQQAQPAPKQTTPAPAPTQQPAPATQAPKAAPAAQSISAIESRVIELTNAERTKAGLKPLQADTSLSNVAREKSRDMQTKGYFSHTSPTYGSPFDMMRDFGVTYRTAGENIAKGQRTAEEVVQAWMNSEGHRKNILSPNFTHIGVGYVQTGNHWTQMFIGK